MTEAEQVMDALLAECRHAHGDKCRLHECSLRRFTYCARCGAMPPCEHYTGVAAQVRSYEVTAIKGLGARWFCPIGNVVVTSARDRRRQRTGRA